MPLLSSQWAAEETAFGYDIPGGVEVGLGFSDRRPKFIVLLASQRTPAARVPTACSGLAHGIVTSSVRGDSAAFRGAARRASRPASTAAAFRAAYAAYAAPLGTRARDGVSRSVGCAIVDGAERELRLVPLRCRACRDGELPGELSTLLSSHWPWLTRVPAAALRGLSCAGLRSGATPCVCVCVCVCVTLLRVVCEFASCGVF